MSLFLWKKDLYLSSKCGCSIFLNMPNVKFLVENYPILFHIKQTKQILKTFKLVFWPQRMSSNAAFARHP